MPLRKRTKFYLGLIIILIATIFLAYVLYMGPHTKIPETTIELVYDHPGGPRMNDIKAGDSFELSFESTEEANVLLMKVEDAGDYFNNPATTVKPITLDTDSTGGYYEHTFDSDGNWRVYFQNPHPPSPRHGTPKVTYWGQIIRQDDDYLYYYLKITTGAIMVLLGAALLLSSRQKPSKGKKKDK